MTNLAFDSLAYAREMEAAGFTRQQAEAFAMAQGKVLREALSATELATKTDLLGVRSDLREEIAAFRAELKEEIANTKHELLKWMIGLLMAQSALLVAILAFLR